MADALTLPQDRPATRRGARIRINGLVAFGGGQALLVVFAAVLAPWISPYDPLATNPIDRFQPPNARHLFGTDDIGRDISVSATRCSDLILAAATVLAIALSIGSRWGQCRPRRPDGGQRHHARAVDIFWRSSLPSRWRSRQRSVGA